MKLALFLTIAAFAIAQEAAQNSTPPPLELNDVEKQFQEALNNVTLIGYFTQGDGKELTDDKYVIERVTKIKEDTWKFEARIQYNKKDFKVAMPLPVKFAGDTPVISLTNFTVPGFGSFTARVVMYNGAYAGTWGSAGANGHGGKLFGRIVKNEPTATSDKPQPDRQSVSAALDRSARGVGKWPHGARAAANRKTDCHRI